MAGQRGRDVLIKISDGGAPETFVAVAGIRARTISLSASLIDATNALSPQAWRELIAGAGTKRAEVAGSGVFKDAASEHRGFTAKDLVAVPWDFSVPDPMTGPEFMTDTVLVQPIGPWDRLATRHWLRFYSVRFPDLPWTVARGRPERVEIKVRKVP